MEDESRGEIRKTANTTTGYKINKEQEGNVLRGVQVKALRLLRSNISNSNFQYQVANYRASAPSSFMDRARELGDHVKYLKMESVVIGPTDAS